MFEGDVSGSEGRDEKRQKLGNRMGMREQCEIILNELLLNDWNK